MMSGLDRWMFVYRCILWRLDPWRAGKRPRWFRNQWIIQFSVCRQTHDNSVSKMFRIPRRAFIPYCLHLPAGSGLASKCFGCGYF